ncbi:hypothetical protein [Arcobacter sp. L]|uniref:hypothetical protein n=1 Tax=Arcobacter sp. L TaxID=944547 RepID=UPI0002295F72|nr:hypothetical protein [Arcobacter sp. L]BAK72826.1 conserved hypothetical protein [Arcobacter sp. L]
MKKTNETKIPVYVIASDKGGTGKSTIGGHALPVILNLKYPDKKINVYELDNNNTTNYINSTLVNFKSLKNKNEESKQAIYNIDFDAFSSPDTISIVDIAGGDETYEVLQKLQAVGLSQLTYFVVMCKDYEHIFNTINTIKGIKKYDPTANINLILNKCTSLDQNTIKKDFISIFGDESIGIPPANDLEYDNLFFIKDCNDYSILKSFHQLTLLDAYVYGKDLLDNLVKYKAEWQKDRDLYIKNLQKVEFARRIVATVEELKPLSKVL